MTASVMMWRLRDAPALRRAITSACAVGSISSTTLLVPSAMTSLPMTTMAPNGVLPSSSRAWREISDRAAQELGIGRVEAYLHGPVLVGVREFGVKLALTFLGPRPQRRDEVQLRAVGRVVRV